MAPRRTIDVEKDWFERLEDHLRADERFVDKGLLVDGGRANIVLYTISGVKLIFAAPPYKIEGSQGPLAQLAEHSPRKAEVAGSNPAGPSISPGGPRVCNDWDPQTVSLDAEPRRRLE